MQTTTNNTPTNTPTSADELRRLTVQLLEMIQDARTLAALYARANRAFVTDGREC